MNPIASMNTSAAQQTILVTGASGFLASRVVPLLSQNVPDCRIIAVTRSEAEGLRDWHVEVVRGDLRDEHFWSTLPSTITTVVHLAATIPWQAQQKYQASLVMENLLPIANLIQYGQGWTGLRHIIYSSSVSVYGPTTEWLNECSPAQPASLYGAAKLSGEDLLICMNTNGVRTVSLRFSSLYARGQYDGTVLPIMVKRARDKKDIMVFGDGTRTQDFLHCEDAARAILLALQRGAGGVYNIGTGTPTTMTELAQSVSRVFSDGASGIVYQPAKADADPGIRLDIGKARRELNYEPRISLADGLRKLKDEMENEKE